MGTSYSGSHAAVQVCMGLGLQVSHCGKVRKVAWDGATDACHRGLPAATAVNATSMRDGSAETATEAGHMHSQQTHSQQMHKGHLQVI